MKHLAYTIQLSLVLTCTAVGPLGCERAETPEGTTPISDTSELADTPTWADRVSCPIACERAARCEKTLTTVEDCTALCDASPSPGDYACCLQFAGGCDGVLECIQSDSPSCEPAGEPWLPLSLGEECDCGATPGFSVECRQESPDHPCPSGTACFKPVNSTDAPTCRVICTGNADKCSDFDLSCTKTPKTWYCD